jgi:ribosome-binding protein aMBF1 (putative translation factor)
MASFTRWQDMEFKVAPEVRARKRREILEEYDRVMNVAELRKARKLTQVELAEKLKMSQAGVAGIESRDVQVSTLSRYVKALGGELQMYAVFPDSTVITLAPVVTERPKHGAR